MELKENLSLVLQESILTALGYCKDNYGYLIAATVDLECFDQPYREAAEKIIEYRKTYNEPPGAGHLDDLFDSKLQSKNEQTKSKWERLIQGMAAQSEHINSEYTYNRLAEFTRIQKLKAGIYKAADLWNASGANAYDEVERILLDTVNRKVELEDPGLFFGDRHQVFDAIFDEDTADYCRLGITELDRRRICPARKELFLFMAGRGKGKTWMLTHIGRYALMGHWKVLHITLEVDAKIIARRYLQAFRSAAKREEEYNAPQLIIEDGIFIKLDQPISVKPDKNLDDKYFQQELTDTWHKWERLFKNLVIKQFPSGQLTIPKLEAYIDGLEIVHKFVPDMVIVDYPALMKLDFKDPRISLGRTVVDLRGMAVQRNLSMVVSSQPNREGEAASEVRMIHTAEDISQIATADVAITYSQTEFEHKLGTARLFADKARNEQDKFTIIISQAYTIGQFALNSVYMPIDYWSRVKALKPNNDT
jgi:hypothetical protein